jgi:hypothetical protein
VASQLLPHFHRRPEEFCGKELDAKEECVLKNSACRKGNAVAEDRLKKLDKQISKLKAQKQALLNRDRAKDRKLRTRRLIQIGAIFEKCLEINSVEEAESFARIAAENPGSIEELKRLLTSSPAPPPHSASDMDLLAVKIDFEEKDLQKQVKEAGGKWDKKKKAWILPPSQIEKLGLQDRVI